VKPVLQATVAMIMLIIYVIVHTVLLALLYRDQTLLGQCIYVKSGLNNLSIKNKATFKSPPLKSLSPIHLMPQAKKLCRDDLHLASVSAAINMPSSIPKLRHRVPEISR
jgi:hypothetical protein